MAGQRREVQEHKIKICTALLMEGDGGFRQEQMRKRGRSREAFRRQTGRHLCSSRFSKSEMAEDPPSGPLDQGSNPGSSSAAESSHPPEKTAMDRELDRTDELFLEMMDIRESRMEEKSGAQVLNEESYRFQCKSTMATGSGS